MGPLAGKRIIEIGGIGPGPVCGMLFADMGAEVVLVDRKSRSENAPEVFMGPEFAIVNRGKKSVALNLKEPGASDVVLRLLEKADGLIEGFRPGVMERLGLGPDACLDVNPRLVYGRLTGWGQHGPLAQAAGHDLNYIALSGALWYNGRAAEPPIAAPTITGDICGGTMMLALGMVAAMLDAQTTGRGQVIDAAITDGSALATVLMYSMYKAGQWTSHRQDNLIDGAAHWYDTYETRDGKYISIGALEPGFYALLLDILDLSDDPDFANQYDRARWPELKRRLAVIFRTKTRDEWCELMEGTDVCFAPVLDFDEAPTHPHNRARETYIEIGGVTQPAPAPRFSETVSEVASPPPQAGQHSDEVLSAAGYSAQALAGLREQGVI